MIRQGYQTGDEALLYCRAVVEQVDSEPHFADPDTHLVVLAVLAD
jgi:hypothetical protein